MKITVFTPTYNRAHTLERLYESLIRQTYKEFEWIIVDDGSTDETSNLIKKFQKDSSELSILYRKVENGGKHRAINIGVQMANGELFFIVDSDDYLPKYAIEKVLEIEKTITIECKCEFAGVCGKIKTLTADIGTSFEGEVLDITYLEAAKYNISGDKAEIYYTEVLRKYPFPEFDNEKFIPESVVWNRIAADGLKLRYFNDAIYQCEYLPDGLTAMGDKKIIDNPEGYGLYLQQMIKYKKLNKMYKWNALLDYYKLLKPILPIHKIAKNLEFNPVKFYFRMLGLRVFYKIYK